MGGVRLCLVFLNTYQHKIPHFAGKVKSKTPENAEKVDG